MERLCTYKHHCNFYMVKPKYMKINVTNSENMHSNHVNYVIPNLKLWQIRGKWRHNGSLSQNIMEGTVCYNMVTFRVIIYLFWKISWNFGLLLSKNFFFTHIMSVSMWTSSYDKNKNHSIYIQIWKLRLLKLQPKLFWFSLGRLLPSSGLYKYNKCSRYHSVSLFCDCIFQEYILSTHIFHACSIWLRR